MIKEDSIPVAVKHVWEVYCQLCNIMCINHPDVMYDKDGKVVSQEQQWENERKYRKHYFEAISQEAELSVEDKSYFLSIVTGSIYDF